MARTVATTDGCRRASFQKRSSGVGLLASTGRLSRKRWRSSARSRAVKYRSDDSLPSRLQHDGFQFPRDRRVDGTRPARLFRSDLLQEFIAIAALIERPHSQQFV